MKHVDKYVFIMYSFYVYYHIISYRIVSLCLKHISKSANVASIPKNKEIYISVFLFFKIFDKRWEDNRLWAHWKQVFTTL